MSKEMIELADEIECSAAGVRDDESAPVMLTGAEFSTIVAALRASAVAEPVAWTNQAQLGFLKDRAYSQVPMAMWSKRLKGCADVALYAHPAPAAPVPASVREALEKIAKMCRPHASNEQFDGTILTIAEAALASLPAPEAAPTREEIIEQCAKVVGDMRQSEAGLFDAAHSGQRGCDRSDALYDAYRAILALKSAPAK